MSEIESCYVAPGRDVTAPLVPGTRMAGRRVRSQSSAILVLRRLIWLYFWLLVFEGALRKWILPQYSSPLLVIRDPLVLLIYFLALKNDLFKSSGFLRGALILSTASLLLASLQFILLKVPTSVLLFGWRTNFLHLPLIFLIPQIMDLREVQRLGKWVLLVGIPMSLLMAYQFKSTPDAWINRTPGLAGGTQLLSALGKIRPPGTFSFITGPVSYFALASAFLVFGLKEGKANYQRPLLAASGLALALALAVSGSRSIVISVGIVAVSWLLSIVAARQVEAGVSKMLILLIITFAVLAQMDLFKEGTEVLSIRWEAASAAESAEGGILGRTLNSLISPLRTLGGIPLFGHGLGVGTNVGATLLTGQAQFLLSEGEWGRVLMEMGSAMGLSFILFRVCLTIWLARLSIRCAVAGNILPLLLFSACAVNIINGQIAQPTTLGFTALGSGLCLATIYGTPLPQPPLRRGRRGKSGRGLRQELPASELPSPRELSGKS